MKEPAQKGFINGISEKEIISALSLMEKDSRYLTKAFYRGASERWTNDYLTFVEYHLRYLKMHTTLDPVHYISNLRLKLRKTPR